MMTFLHRLILSALLATFAFTNTVPEAEAHPHAWIDLRSTIKLDAEGRITALVMDWTFGLYYSAFILEGILEAKTPLQETLDVIARENLENLREFDYFTFIKADGEKQDLGEVQTFETAIRDNRLWMRFEIPLKTPVSPTAKAVTFAVYDPTYYIEVLYAETGTRVAFEDTGNTSVSSRCEAQIIAPNPTMEERFAAADLGPDESGGTSLGQLFAEKVVLTCK